MRSVLIFFFLAFILTTLGCGSAADSNNGANTNALANNTNGFRQLDANNLPPGLSASPIAPGTNTTPGIPPPSNVVNAIPKGTTPTPGIPDPKTANKMMKPGATPTPGIPDPANMRRQLEQRNSNMSSPPPPPPGSGETMMRSKKPRAANTNN